MAAVVDEVRREALEQLAAVADQVPFPDALLVHSPMRHGYREHAYVALRPMAVGSRRVHAGDLLAEAEGTTALARMVAHGDVAELPLDHGVLALVLGLRAKVELLEAQLGGVK